jgi:hypothetical protein
MIKRSVHPEDLTIPKTFVPQNRACKPMKHCNGFACPHEIAQNVDRICEIRVFQTSDPGNNVQ